MAWKQELKTLLGERFKENEPLARHTNFRIGGPADFFAVVETRAEAVQTIKILQAARALYFILGGGSNVLASDRGYRGVVVQLALRKIEIKGEAVRAEAGTPTALLARATVEAGLVGLEWAIGLPGTIGGAVRGNAGCYGGEMKDSVASVDVLVLRNGELAEENWSAEKSDFSYRESAFKKIDPAPVVLAINFQLKKGEAEAGRRRQVEILGERRQKQPLENSSAGCIFKNVELTGEENLTRLKKDVDIPPEFLAKKRIPAGWLIEQVGLKGFAIGGARISDKHGNFTLNAGKATADEVVELISLIKTRVRAAYGIELMEEIQYLGF